MGMQTSLNHRTYQLKEVRIKHNTEKITNKNKKNKNDRSEFFLLSLNLRNVFRGIKLTNLFVDEGFCVLQTHHRDKHTMIEMKYLLFWSLL